MALEADEIAKREKQMSAIRAVEHAKPSYQRKELYDAPLVRSTQLAVLVQDGESAQKMKPELWPLLKVVERTPAKTKTEVQGKENQGHGSFK